MYNELLKNEPILLLEMKNWYLLDTHFEDVCDKFKNNSFENWVNECTDGFYQIMNFCKLLIY